MKTSNRFLAITLISAMVITTVLPRRSEAVVGIVTGGTGFYVAGGIIGGLGTLVMASDLLFYGPCGPMGNWCAIWGPAVAAGVILLDEKSTPENELIQFSELSDETANHFGITSDEKSAFNSELDLVNSIVQSANEDLNRYSEELDQTLDGENKASQKNDLMKERSVQFFKDNFSITSEATQKGLHKLVTAKD